MLICNMLNNLYGIDAFRFDVLEHVECTEDLLAREQHYVDILKPDYNIALTAGSSLGVKRTPEFIEKVHAANTGRKHTLESRLNMGAPKRGVPHTREHVEKIAAAHRGRKLSEHAAKARVRFLGGKHTPEARAKMSEARRGKKQSPEHIAKRAEARRGKKQSPEHATKSRVTFLGRKHTPETRAKMSAAHRGKKHTPEHVAKIKATKAARRVAKLAQQQINLPPLF